MDFNKQQNIRVTCAPFLVPYLIEEVEALGFSVTQQRRTDIHTAATMMDAIRMNLLLRSAISVLVTLDEFKCKDPDQLYQRINKIPWEEIISPDERLTVVSSVRTPTITDSRFANLRVKDAIVDRIAQKKDRRPDSGSDRSGVVVNLSWQENDASIYLNMSGRKLADRNYRKNPYKAPMQETLAAAVVMATEYDGTMPLINPMCGSGTLAIEAALIASGRAPGLLRTNFGFEHVLGFDADAFRTLRKSFKKSRSSGEVAPIIATDNDERAIEAAKSNAETAGVHRLIDFSVCDFADTPLPDDGGIVLLNPEYGERLGEMTELETTYKRIGDFFKKRCSGSTGYVFTGNLDLAKKIGLKVSRRIEFQSAKIDCRLLKYELYQGTLRQ